MKLKTCLQLSAIFPIVFAITVVSILEWRFKSLTGSDLGDIALKAGLALLGLVMAAVIIWYSREMLRKVRLLNEWSDAVLQGDLDRKVAFEPGNDELGRLSGALSRMLLELKENYNTLQQDAARLRQENSQHKKGAQSSQLATRQLADTLYKVKESQQEAIHKERMRVLEQVVRGITHDLNDAMTPILGISELLLARPAQLEQAETVRTHLEAIHESAVRVCRTLKNLSGSFTGAEERAGPTDVNRAIGAAIEQTQPRWKAAGVDIRLRTELEDVPAVSVDGVELQDAVGNLILNAVEAMPSGGVLTLSSRREKRLVRLQVTDTGTGMPPEVVQRCLEPFFSTKDGSDGRGMGLTVASSVVRRYGGDLHIASQPGRGTEVTLLLPVWICAQPETAVVIEQPPALARPPEARPFAVRPAAARPTEVRTPAAAPAGRAPADGLRVMVVDDNVGSRDIIAAIVRSRGHAVDVATSGAECLGKVETGAFDVAIVDRAMPEMDGDQLAAELKQRRPGMPVIMLTGFGDQMIGAGHTPPHVDLVLAKPVSVQDLQQGIARVLAPKA